MNDASFNIAETNGLPSIVISGSGGSNGVWGACRSREGEIEWRRTTFVFPGIDGEGSVTHGRAPADLFWDLELRAPSLDDLLAFEGRFAAYRMAEFDAGDLSRAGYRLYTEAGVYFDNVQFVSFERLSLESVAAVGPDGQLELHMLRRALVKWRWMRPA